MNILFLMSLIKLYDWILGLYIGWRNEREVEMEMKLRRGFKKAGRLGWVKV